MQIKVLTGELMSNGVPCLGYILKWSIHCTSLSDSLQSSTNQELFKNTSVIKVATMKNMDGSSCPHLCQLLSESEVSIMLLFLLCSTYCISVKIKNCSKSTSVIKIASMKIWNNFHYERKLSPFLLSAKTNGTQRRTLVSPWRIHCFSKEF